MKPDLADLIATNTDNSVIGKFPKDGRPWHAIRVVVVDRTEVSEALTLEDNPKVDLARDGYQVRWQYEDMAFPIVPGELSAGQIARFYLRKKRPDQEVRGCVVWIGERRFWVEYASPWNGEVPKRVIETTPRPSP